MTKAEAIKWFEEQIEIMKHEQPPATNAATAICHWLDMIDKFTSLYRLALCALKKQVEYEDLEEQGRLVVLPCKVGDTVYQLRHKQHAKGVGISPRIVSSACVWSDGSYALCHQGMTYCQSKDLGKTWFLSREEAEKALRGEE